MVLSDSNNELPTNICIICRNVCGAVREKTSENFICKISETVRPSLLLMRVVRHMWLAAVLGPLTRLVKLWVAHAPGMPGTYPSPPISQKTASYRSRYASRHVRHARAVMHVGTDNPRWQGKGSRRSQRMRNSQFYISDKRPVGDARPTRRPQPATF